MKAEALKTKKVQLRVAVGCLTSAEANSWINSLVALSVALMHENMDHPGNEKDEPLYDIETDISKYIDSYDGLAEAFQRKDIGFLTCSFLEKYESKLPELYRRNPDCHIIVCGGSISALPNYLRARPVGYISAPEDCGGIVCSWIHCIQEHDHTKHTLYMETKQGVFALSSDEIVYCQSDLKYINVVTDSGKLFRKLLTLSKFSEMLPDYFIRIHQSFLVNKHRVKGISRGSSGWEVITNDGLHLPVSRTYQKSVSACIRNIPE